MADVLNLKQLKCTWRKNLRIRLHPSSITLETTTMFKDQSDISTNVWYAIALLQAEEPLPTFLTADLLEEGVDVSELQKKYEI